VAHIVAETPTGPRGDATRSLLLCNEVNNLMLLCHVHHKLIDVDQVDQHPEYRLRPMKTAHEVRIDIVTNIKEDRASHVLRFAAQIGDHESPVSYDMISTAMLPDLYPAEGRRTIDIELLGSSYRDHEPQFWDFHRQNLERQFANRVRERIDARDIRHLSLFALAPQPLLIALGRLLGDITPCIVHQLQREPKTWRWQEGPPVINYRERRPERTNGTPALVLGISATIVDERVHNVLGPDAAIWAIEAEQPHNDILKREADLSEFRRRFALNVGRHKGCPWRGFHDPCIPGRSGRHGCRIRACCYAQGRPAYADLRSKPLSRRFRSRIACLVLVWGTRRYLCD